MSDTTEKSIQNWSLTFVEKDENVSYNYHLLNLSFFFVSILLNQNDY